MQLHLNKMTISEKPKIDIFTDTKSLGIVYKEQIQLTPKFWEFNFPLADTEGHTALNLGGITRIIMIQGAMDGEGFTGATPNLKIKNFVTTMEAWVNVIMQGTQIYTSSLGTTYNVKCFDFTWNRSMADPTRILYSILLKEV